MKKFRLWRGRGRIGDSAVGQAQPWGRFRQLLGERPGVDDRNGKAPGDGPVRLVHRGRAKKDHVRAVPFDAPAGERIEGWEDLLLLTCEQVLVVGNGIQRTDRFTRAREFLRDAARPGRRCDTTVGGKHSVERPLPPGALRDWTETLKGWPNRDCRATERF